MERWQDDIMCVIGQQRNEGKVWDERNQEEGTRGDKSMMMNRQTFWVSSARAAASIESIFSTIPSTFPRPAPGRSMYPPPPEPPDPPPISGKSPLSFSSISKSSSSSAVRLFSSCCNSSPSLHQTARNTVTPLSPTRCTCCASPSS